VKISAVASIRAVDLVFLLQIMIGSIYIIYTVSMK